MTIETLHGEDPVSHAMRVYLSHSYRDEAINQHFRSCFEEEDVPLGVDQKTDIWCVAKLERSLGALNGFVSIIPRRVSEEDPGAYSAYIGQELNMARRARVPRLLFVDEAVHRQHRLEFPEDALTFRPEALDELRSTHIKAIRSFSTTMETTHRPHRSARQGEAAVFVGKGRNDRGALRDVEELLSRAGYSVTHPLGRDPEYGLNDIRMLEGLWRAELCVFMLGQRLSEVHVALAMAHAECIPSLRLQFDPSSTDCSPTLSGVIRWSSRDAMLVELQRQIDSYKQGLVKPTRDTSLMAWHPRDEQRWNVRDRAGLIDHVHPEHVFVRDEVSRSATVLGRPVGRTRGREDGFELFEALYGGIQRHRFAYEIEPVTADPEVQAIRSPSNVASHRSATCIDLACLFSALLEAAGQQPIIVVIDGPGFSHALAGYRVMGEPATDVKGLGDLRGAVARHDAELFEVTGAVESDAPVTAEELEGRREKLLSVLDARAAAERMLRRNDITIRHFIDVRAMRADRTLNDEQSNG